MSSSYTIGTLSGQTTGTLTGRDYGPDLQSINTSLGTLNSNITLLTAAVTKLDTNLTGGVPDPTGTSLGVLQALFGPGAGASSAGTIPYNTGAAAKQLESITDHLDRLADNTAGVGGSIQEKSQDLANLASQFAIFNASAQIFIAQNARKNAFEVAATNSALERSGLPEVEVPQASVTETITASVEDAVTVNSQATVSGFINTQISSATGFAADVVTNYISSTQLGGIIATKFASLKSTLLGADPDAATDKTGETDADTKTTGIT